MRNPIQVNKHPLGRLNNMHFGLCTLCDGLVRILSFGFLHTDLALVQARNATKKQIEKLKKERDGS